MSSIVRSFRAHFEILPADTRELRDKAYALRYQVYCQERRFEDTIRYQDGREWDEYDSYAIQSLIRHRNTGVFVGCVRLILPRFKDLYASLPLELECGDALDPQHWAVRSATARSRLGEISRFAVLREYKDCLSDELSSESATQVTQRGMGPFRNGSHRSFPWITLGLIVATIQMSVKHGIAHWYALMQPSLLRLLAQFGVHFQPVGSLVSHRGCRRYPTAARVGDVVQEVRADVRELLLQEGSFLKLLRDAPGLAIGDEMVEESTRL